MFFFRSTIFLLLAAGIFTANLFAQQQQQQQQVVSPEQIKDSELVQFADASGKMESIQQEAVKEIKDIVEKKKMNFERFQQIMAALQNPQLASEVDIKDSEKDQLDEIQPEVETVQKNTQQKMIKAITDCGLTIDRYQSILLSLKQNPGLVERLEKLKD